MSLHARGQQMANRVAAAEGLALLYTRGATTEAVAGEPTQEDQVAVTNPTPGTRLTDRERDYLFNLSALVAAGFGEPLEGDKVTEVINGVATTFRVTPKTNEPAWRWADVGRSRLLVHTRKV